MFRINADGSFEQVIDLDSGSADIAYLESESLPLVPMMKDGTLAAYRLESPRPRPSPGLHARADVDWVIAQCQQDLTADISAENTLTRTRWALDARRHRTRRFMANQSPPRDALAVFLRQSSLRL